MNLGPDINTAEREMFPFIGEDNVLYFSSDGYPGYGELDVYASKVFDNTVSQPMNLEEPVNSPMDDFAYIIDDTKNKGYFSSNREGGRGDDDIYSFTASPPIYIECQQEITGVVRNLDTQELIPNVKIMLFDQSGKKLETFMSDENDASFGFSQSCNTTYKIKGYLEGYLIGELDITTVNDLNADPLEIVFHMEDDPSLTVDPIAAADPGNDTSEESAPTIMGALAASEPSVPKENNHVEKDASKDMGDGSVAGNIDATTFEEDSVEVTEADGKGANDGIETYAPGQAVAVNEATVPEEDNPVESDASKDMGDGTVAGNVDATTFEEDSVEVTEADGKDDNDGSETYAPGQAVAMTEEKQQIEGSNRTNGVAIEATTFEHDRVRTGEAGGAKQGSVQISEENGFNINTIYFDYDKYAIRSDARIELDKLLNWLQENPELKIEVNAHTDIRGTEKYNQKLSDKRANQTISYLTDRGVDPMRISGKGFGETQVAVPCTKANPCNGLQHQLNRRSEFYLRNPETNALVFRSRNRTPSLKDENGMYASNSGLYMNYNFYEDDQVYTVQVGAFKGKIQTDKYSKLKTLFNHRYDDGLNRYYSGIFESASAARAHLEEMRKQGFTDAFVVELKGEDRRL
jgi:outer membrane protein OmpA-like peptidoglycan-associated protein